MGEEGEREREREREKELKYNIYGQSFIDVQKNEIKKQSMSIERRR